MDFLPSRIGSYWSNDYGHDIQIDVMAVDYQHKRLFAGECKYHKKPVDVPVYFVLKEKVASSGEIGRAFPGYEILYGVFSRSGFTDRLKQLAGESGGPLLIYEEHVA